jgi:hypothetical protein
MAGWGDALILRLDMESDAPRRKLTMKKEDEKCASGSSDGQASSTSCVCVTMAHSFPSADLTAVCHTIVVLPR